MAVSAMYMKEQEQIHRSPFVIYDTKSKVSMGWTFDLAFRKQYLGLKIRAWGHHVVIICFK